ncbi:hypothetical protein BBF96_11905 [Anoxybacter fermentans]|uniref:Metallo-beta-lactamase domain-containing protein n=1 Tax=Anoxybacter fermentans TaxID=1323375 RepID=A0A3S9T0K8_9FIRM|nr:MBL fold metallo-hydrolase [Anoxybacter fermentans]AZR74035.1 hypothetical protein BBF96_11905 [Anoxybacter fermentans]
MNYDLKLYEKLSQYTLQVVKNDRQYWKEEILPYCGTPKILFMGTGGNPVNLLEQVRQTGGFILYLPGFTLAVDPGPGVIWHVKQNGVDIRALDGIYISHGHTDHYLGAPLLIEGMTRVMSQRRGVLLLPRDVSDENLISIYHQGRHQHHEGYVGGPEKIVYLQEKKMIELTDEIFLTPVKAYHGKMNYGFVITTPTFTIGYTSDTSYLLEYEDLNGLRHKVGKWVPISPPTKIIKYREDLKEIFSQVDYLIANVSYFNLFAKRHITAVGLAHMLMDSKVKRCWMTHLDVCCIRPEPIAGKMAQFVAELSGVDVVVAEDNHVYYIR